MKTDYELIKRQLVELSLGISYDISILANASALLYSSLGDLNWCGFRMR